MTSLAPAGRFVWSAADMTMCIWDKVTLLFFSPSHLFSLLLAFIDLISLELQVCKATPYKLHLLHVAGGEFYVGWN